MSSGRRILLALAMLLPMLHSGAARAYAPGTGTLFTDGFQDGDDGGWSSSGNLSRWTVADRAGSKVYLADSVPDLFRGLPETSRRTAVAVPVGSVDLCFALNAPLVATSSFTADLRPPREDQPHWRLALQPDGSLAVQLVVARSVEVVAVTPPGRVAPGMTTWIRVRLRDGAAGARDAFVRSWIGGAAAEPATWDAQGTTAGPDGVPYLQRLEISATQPAGRETWIDEVDAFGDSSGGVLSSIRTVWIVEGSHLDIGFTEPPDEIEAFAKTHLDQVAANLAAAPDYRFTIESSWQLMRFLERSTPAEAQGLLDFARQGRLSLAAGYCNLHTTLASREELIRALRYSHEAGTSEGFPIRTFIENDVPGATWAMPELLAKAGVPYYVGGMNVPFGGVIDRPSHAERPFWWEGPDGSRVLSWITFDSYAEGLGLYGMSFFDRLPQLKAGLGIGLGEQEGLGYPHENLMVMRIFDNHYQGLFVKGLVDQWNATYATPRLRLSTPEEFFEAVQQEIAAKGWTIPVYRGDFGAAWTAVVPGTAHTQRMVNEARREAEAAEILGAAESAFGGAHPSAALDLAWRRILEVDEHSGGGIPWPGYMTPEETDRQSLIHQGYAIEARDQATGAAEGLAAALASRVDLPGGGIVVFNALDAPRSGPVGVLLPPEAVPGRFRLIDAARGIEVPYQVQPTDPQRIEFVARDVPGPGYAAFRMIRGVPADPGPGDLLVTPTSVENAHYRVTVDPSDGAIASMVHLASGRELVDGGAPWRFGLTASSLNSGIFWGVTPTADAAGAAGIAVIAEDGPVSASLVVLRPGSPASATTIRLHRDLDAVEIVSSFDRDSCPYVPIADHSRTYAYTFPFSLTDFDFGTESPGGLLHPVVDGFQRTSTWMALNSTGCVDVEDGLGGLVLALPDSMVFEWGGISNLGGAHRTGAAHLFARVKAVADEAQWEGGTVGPVDDEPGLPATYPLTLRLRVRAPGASDAAVRRDGHALSDPLRGVFVASADGPAPAGGRAFFALDDPAVRLATVQRAMDGSGLVARIEDVDGAGPRDVRLSSVFALSSPEECTLHEEPLRGLALDASAVRVPVAPRSTTTIRVGAAAALSPALLFVTKDEQSGEVRLSWRDGVPRFRVLRSPSRDLASGTTTIAQDLDARSHADPALRDGMLWYYDVQ